MTRPCKEFFLNQLVLILSLPVIFAYFGLTAREPILSISQDLDPSQIYRLGRHKMSSAKLCEMLKLEKKQKRMCRRGKGVAETLLEASKLSLYECRYQFNSERWNCTLGKYREHLLRKGFKQTSFLYAISSAGLVHAFARACSQGILDRCTCDESKHLENRQAWLWGGCGDNIRFGLKFTRKFLKRARKSGKDVRAKVDQHNSRVGIKVVKENVNTTCKCHGVSGSCTVKTCWLQLAKFHTIGRVIKSKYENALKVGAQTNQATGKSQLVKRQKLKMNNYAHMHVESDDSIPKRGDLVYMEESPNFCRRTKHSPGTSGRLCNKGKNCDVICCGRGYNVQHITVKRACQCQVIWCCRVNCKRCETDEEIYMCK